MENWRDDLETWLAPFVSALGHKTRARMSVLAVCWPMRDTGRAGLSAKR